MTPDQLPAGLPMDDKIEAWIREGERLMSEFTAVLVDDGFSDCAALVKADAAMRAHLRTTPEGFRLVPVEPTEAVLSPMFNVELSGDPLAGRPTQTQG